MEPRIRSLYKLFLFAGRTYPGAGGFNEVRKRAKQAFSACLPEGELDPALKRGTVYILYSVHS